MEPQKAGAAAKKPDQLYPHRFYHRFLRALLLAGALIGISLCVGIAGYHYIARFDWIDALLNASMILT